MKKSSQLDFVYRQDLLLKSTALSYYLMDLLCGLWFLLSRQNCTKYVDHSTVLTLEYRRGVVEKKCVKKALLKNFFPQNRMARDFGNRVLSMGNDL